MSDDELVVIREYRDSDYKYPELKLSLFEEVLIIDYVPARKVKITSDHLNRFLGLIIRSKKLSFREKVQLTKISFD